MRVSLLSYKMPEVDGPSHGVFSKIPRHSPNHDQRNLDTNYQISHINFFSNNKKENRIFNFAGYPSDVNKIQRRKLNTNLISENYFNSSSTDLKYNNSIQRTWTYHRDPAMNAVDNLKIDNITNTQLRLPPIENELSLNIREKAFDSVKDKIYNGCAKKPSDINKRNIIIPFLRKS